MRTRDLMDFAANLADQYPAVMQTCSRLDEPSLQQYWVTSQARFNLWGTKLRLATDQLNATTYGPSRLWAAWAPVFEELLVDDVTTRVWATMLHSLDERLGLGEYSPIGRSVVRGHDDARQRVVNLILKGKHAGSDVAIRLESVRQGIERWTDVLLARASAAPATAAYCHDADRYGYYLTLCDEGGTHRLGAFELALRVALGRTSVIPSHVDLHERLQHQITHALGPDTSESGFDSAPGGADSWQTRMISLTEETGAMIERWLDPELLSVDDRLRGDARS